MAAGTFFQAFSEHLAEGVHDFGTDLIEAYLSNAAPSAAADAVFADLAQITTGFGYAGPIDLQNATGRSGATTSVTGVDATITASGGSIGPFQHVVLRNNTPTSPLDPLISYYSASSAVTLAAGESYDLDIGTSLFTVAPA